MRSLVALLALFLFAAAQSPAVKTSISDKSFQKIVDQFMPLVDSKLATITVPDINQTVDTKIGKVQISLTDIIAHVAPPNVGVSVAQGKGIMGSISQLSTQVDLNFDFNVVKIFSGRGSAHVTTTNGNVNLIIDIVDQDGKPALVVAGNQIDFGKLDIKISSSSGIPSWIENILVNLLADILKNTLQKTIQNEVATLVQQLSDKYLTKMPTIVPLDSHVQVDMALAGNPIFNGGFVTFPLVGAFQERAQPSRVPPFPPAPMPDEMGLQMVQLLWGDYIFDSAWWAYGDLGVLNFALTDKELPAWFPLRLNTHSWRFLLPELNRRYPNQEMALRGVMAEAPDTVITPEGARTEAMLDLHFVVLNGTEETTAIIFRIDFTSSADFFIDTPAATAGPVIRIGAHIAYGSCNITTQASTIGPVDAWLLNDTLAALLKGVVVPALNKLAERGVQIPLAVKQFELVHPALTYAQDYLVVETDFTFIA